MIDSKDNLNLNMFKELTSYDSKATLPTSSWIAKSDSTGHLVLCVPFTNEAIDKAVKKGTMAHSKGNLAKSAGFVIFAYIYRSLEKMRYEVIMVDLLAETGQLQRADIPRMEFDIESEAFDCLTNLMLDLNSDDKYVIMFKELEAIKKQELENSKHFALEHPIKKSYDKPDDEWSDIPF